jgi:hypothetical protein
MQPWQAQAVLLALLLAMPTVSRLAEPDGGRHDQVPERRHPPDELMVLFPCKVVKLEPGRAYLSVPFMDGPDGSCVRGASYRMHAVLAGSQSGVSITEARSFSTKDLRHGALAIALPPMPAGGCAPADLVSGSTPADRHDPLI